MTTVSRANQVSHTNVAGTGDWDHRLNRLLEDLQETVIPSDSKVGNATEYREFRMTQRTQVNDEPAQQVDENWVEYGTQSGGNTVTLTGNSQAPYGGGSGLTSSRYGSNSEQKSVAFSDDFRSSNGGYEKRDPQIEFLAPANSTTILKSGPSSPTNYGNSSSPKVERKEFYAKASYTTLIKGSPNELGGMPALPPGDNNRAERLLEDLIPPDFRTTPAVQQSSSSETKRTFMSSSSENSVRRALNEPEPIGQPLYSSTPLKSSSTTRDTREYNRELITDRNRAVTPPPKPGDALKTPPMIRKILQASQNQQNQHQHQHQHSSSSTSTSYHKSSANNTSAARPPVGGVPLPIIHTGPTRDHIQNYDDPPERHGARYYTSTTTTEHRTDREMSPVKRFPSPHANKVGDGEPPKRLDELLATFGDTSYTESSSTRYGGGDGPGAHKSIPYGPGTHPVQPLRSVRIDDNVQQREIDEDSELIQRKSARKLDASDGNRNMAGPPVYFPPGQIFEKTQEEALMSSEEGSKGKGKMKMKREYKEKEKMKSKHSEKDRGGALPVPVCLPVCCAAPCVIM